MTPRICERCGKPYVPRSASHPTRFCGKDCAKANAKREWVRGEGALKVDTK